MANTSILLGVRLSQNDFKRVEIENTDLEMKVNSFKDQITKQIGVEKESIDLIYCGIILDDEKSLSSCGIKPGVMVHVLKKAKQPTPAVSRPIKYNDIKELAVAFRAFIGYRAALQRLSRPEVLETIKAATPGLAEDPIAMAIIQDPELIVQLSDIETAMKIAVHHPSLIEAANHIAAHVHEETASSNTARAGTSTGYSYSLEALSDDDDDMDSSQNESNREANPLTRNTSYGTITAAQLADAILNSTQNMSFGASNSVLPTVSGVTSGGNAQPSTPNSNVITNEMFLNAIQQAFSSSPATANTTTSGTYNTNNASLPDSNLTAAEPMENLRSRLQVQLRQMREMGLTNEALNIRALQITSGDVQGAVELVFNGAIE